VQLCCVCASGILERIGWFPRTHNLSIACHNKNHKGEKDKPKTTHGEDQIFLYNSPFFDGRTEVVHVSVKHVGKYPSQTTLRTKLKAHIQELNEIIDCAKNSSEIYELLSSFGAKAHVNHCGLLIWLQNDETAIEFDIKPLIADAQIPKELHFPIYLVDNARASFLLKAVYDLKSRSPDSEIEFYYPSIGTNITVNENRYGPTLPIDMVASDIVIGLVRASTGNELVLYVNQGFSQSAYRRLMTYALQFANGLVNTVRIGMPDFNPAAHEKDVAVARQAFSDRQEKVEPFAFNLSVLTLLEE